MFHRLLIAIFCFTCLSAAATKRFPRNPKLQPYFINGALLERQGEYTNFEPVKRAFSFQAARGKKNFMGEKIYLYYPSRG